MSRKSFSRKAVGIGLGAFLLTAPAIAGNVTGNSGHVVVCRDDASNQVTKVELLDFYLARETYYREIDLGPDNLDLYAKAAFAIDRIDRLDPRRAELYRGFLAEFPRAMGLVQGPLPEQPDIYVPPMLPRNCNVQQLAVRRRDADLPSDRRYVVDRDLWDLLSPDDRAGLIIHEIVYRDSVSHGGDAFGYAARYLTGLFGSRDTASVGVDEYNAMMLRKYMVGYTVGSADSRWTLFDDVSATLDEAKNFCRGIGDGARLSPYDNWIILANLPIARHIDEAFPDGYVDAWFNGSNGGSLYRLERDRGAPVASTPEEMHAFVCLRHE